MSALPPKADIGTQSVNVRFVPKADIVAPLRDSIASRCLTKEQSAGFWRAFLCLEIDVYQSKAVPEARGPLEVVQGAPLEITHHRNTIGARTLELRQVTTEKHNAVGVVNFAVVRQYIIAGAAVLGDVDLLCPPERLHELRRPVQSLGP